MRTLNSSQRVSASPLRLRHFARALAVLPLLAAWSACSPSGSSSPGPGGGTGNESGSGSSNGGTTNSSTGGDTTDNGGSQINFGGGTFVTNLDAGGGCAKASATATLVPANILFIIDRSGSMNCNLPPITTSAECETTPTQKDTTKPSKWQVVRDSLKQAIAALPPSTSAGITYFSNDNTCGVQSKPNVDIALLTAGQIAALDDSLDGVKPQGGTPLVGAVTNAYKRLNPNQYPNQPLGNKFVVLITDGKEDCVASAVPTLINTTAPLALNGAHVKTFVVGVPGSEVDRSVLSNLAVAGGTPSSPSCNHSQTSPDVGDCHFDMTTQPDLATGLKNALAAISGQALSCEFPIVKGSQQVDPTKVNVNYTPSKGAKPVTVIQDASKACSAANGWQYTDNTNSKIVVCGAACDAVKKAASIDIVLGCQTIIQ
jgi:hypothetical protein